MIRRVLPHRLPAVTGKRNAARGLPIASIAIGLAVALAGCGSSGSSPGASGGKPTHGARGTFPVTVVAANGSVHVSKKPTAIVSLSPTVTEMLYAIGAGAQVKAVDNNSDFPASAPRTKLSGFNPNIEAIVAEKPDLVVISTDPASAALSLAKRLATFSIPLLSLPAPKNVSGVYSEFDQLGEATGHEQQAQHEVASLRTQVAKVIAAVPHHAKPLTYYYELDQTYFSVTSDTFIGRLLGLLGMKSIADAAKGAAAAGGYPQLSAEYIVKADPDYIILADTICCHQSVATVSSRPGWAGLTAVKDKHIIALNDDIASRWGPRIVDLLRTVLAGIRGGH